MNIKNILLGCLLGVALAVSPASLFVLALFLASLYLIRCYIKTGSKQFLTAIFLTGFIIRVVLSFLNYNIGILTGTGSDTQPDARVYNNNALYIASVIRGHEYTREIAKDDILRQGMDAVRSAYNGNLPSVGTYQFSVLDAVRSAYNGNLPSVGTYQFSVYVYLIGLFYTYLGYAPVAIKIINGLVGCLSAILTYVIAKKLIKSEIAAKISAGVMMFWPSAVYWSVTSLKDPIANFLFLLYVLALIIYSNKNSVFSLISAFVIMILLSLFKEKIILLLAAGFIFVLLVQFLKKVIVKNTVRLWLVIMPALFLLMLILIMEHDVIRNFIAGGLKAVIHTHLFASSDPSAATYKLYDTADGVAGISIPGLIFLEFKALIYYFLTPFPWKAPYSHIFLLAFYPQVILTLLSIPFMIIGVVRSMRSNFLLTLTTIVLLALIIVPQAMAEGIIGNVVRHRDMFMPFLIIFSSYGFYSTALAHKKTQSYPV